MSQEDSSNVVTTVLEGEAITPPEGQVAPEQVTTPPEVNYLQLDRSQLYRELARLEAEDPEVKQVLGTFIGNKANRQYRPEIQRRDSEIAQLKNELFAAQVKSMDETQIEAKVVADRDWGKKYIDYVHEARSPQAPKPVDETPLVEQALAEIMDFAQRNGMSDTDWGKYISKAQNGGYGDNQTHWSVSLARLQQDVANDLITKPKVPTLQTTNPNLTKGGPDMSTGSGSGSSGSFPKSAAEFNSLPHDTQVKWLATDRDKVIALSQK